MGAKNVSIIESISQDLHQDNSGNTEKKEESPTKPVKHTWMSSDEVAWKTNCNKYSMHCKQ